MNSQGLDAPALLWRLSQSARKGGRVDAGIWSRERDGRLCCCRRRRRRLSLLGPAQNDVVGD